MQLLCYRIIVQNNGILYVGFGFDDGSKSLKKCAHDFFSSYIREGRCDVLVFSSEFMLVNHLCFK